MENEDLQKRVQEFWNDNYTTDHVATSVLMIPCPDEKCVGYVRTDTPESDYKCSTCNATVCNSCREIVDESKLHACDPNVLSSLKLLETDTVACPTCHSRIHQIEGCYQMWCTQCHAMFDYKTGKILNERCHNPHYIDWLKTTTDIPITDGENDLMSYAILQYVITQRQHDIFMRFFLSVRRAMDFLESTLLPDQRYRLQRASHPVIAHNMRMAYVDKVCTEPAYIDYLYRNFCDYNFISKLFAVYKQSYDEFHRILYEYIYDFRAPAHAQKEIFTCTQVHNHSVVELHTIYKRKVFKFYSYMSPYEVLLMCRPLPGHRIFEFQKLTLRQLALDATYKTSATCDLCIEPKRRCVVCPTETCKYTVCSPCVMRLLDGTVRSGEYKCPACKNAVTFEYVIPIFGRSWFKTACAVPIKKLLLEEDKKLIPKSLEYKHLVETLRKRQFKGRKQT